jgi:hypothetical protein
MTNASGTKDKASSGDPIPPKCSVIEVHVGELKHSYSMPSILLRFATRT